MFGLSDVQDLRNLFCPKLEVEILRKEKVCFFEEIGWRLEVGGGGTTNFARLVKCLTFELRCLLFLQVQLLKSQTNINLSDDLQ